MNEFVKSIPWSAVGDALKALHEAGWEKEAAIEYVSALLDQSLQLEDLLPAPYGTLAESVDGPVIRASLTLIWGAIERAAARRKREGRSEGVKGHFARITSDAADKVRATAEGE